MITPSPIPADVRGYAEYLVHVLRDGYGDDLIGVYLHGSAVLGGFGHEYSDVDVLVVVANPGPVELQQKVGEALVNTLDRCPGTGLELSVITSPTAAKLGDCPFEVHVNANSRAAIVIPGADHAGDLDLLLHSAVCRDHGLALSGPAPAKVFAAVPRARLLTAMRTELEWGRTEAPMSYAVLNACRVLRYLRDGQLVGKVAAAQWYLAESPGTGVVTAALAQQRRGEKVRPLPPAATDFVLAAITALPQTPQIKQNG